MDTQFLFYKESGGRTEVLNPMMQVHQDLGETGQLDLLLAYDAISGASPTGGYPTSEVTTSASGHLVSIGSFPQVEYRDTRRSVSLAYGRRFGSQLPTIDLSYSKENDYTARSFGISDAWTMAQGRGTLHFAVSFDRDTVAPVTNHLRFPKSTNGYSLGYTWILGERDLVDVSASWMQLSGYLNDPYKVVPIGDPAANTTLPDHRPNRRARRALVVKYGHHFLWNGAVRVFYRFYDDDWSVGAHALEVTYDQGIGDDWIVSPQVRLYTQTGASFYGSLFSSPRTYMSADYRLSPLDSAQGGLTVSRRIGDALNVHIGATLQSQKGRDRILSLSTSQEEGAGPARVSPADLTVWTVTAGFTWRY